MALKRGEVAWRTAPRKVATAQYLSAPMAPPRMASSAARSSSFCLMRRMVDSRFERVERNVEMESGEKVKNAKTEKYTQVSPLRRNTMSLHFPYLGRNHSLSLSHLRPLP